MVTFVHFFLFFLTTLKNTSVKNVNNLITLRAFVCIKKYRNLITLRAFVCHHI